jgi:Ca2+-binding RTX toxin-like protein
MKRFGWKTWGLVCTGALNFAACADDVGTQGPVVTGEDFSGVEELAMPLTALATPCDFATLSGVPTATVTVADGETAIISKRAVDSALIVNGVQCGTATSTTVKRVAVNGSTGANTVIFDFINGTFAPGYGTTAGVVVDLLGGTDSFKIRGSGSADTVTFGADGFSFNADTIKDGTVAGAEEIVVSLGAGNDIFSGSGGFGTGATSTAALEAYGGEGNDTLSGGTGADTLHGGAGADTLRGAADAALDVAADTLNGDADNDTFDAGNATNGGDTFNGGGGTDIVSYANRTNDLTVTMGAGANDGETGETDNVAADVETLTGGAGDDTLTGGAIANTINGGAGDDTLSGGAEDDTLNGDAGDDTFLSAAADDSDVYNGGAGTDTMSYDGRTAAVEVSLDGVAEDGEDGELDNVKADVEDIIGGDGNDVLTGSASNNTITGGDGDDTIDGGAGNDTFVAAATDDGSDTFTGGLGVDTVDYSARTADLTVTMDGVDADDGLASEADDVNADVEDIICGEGDDTITGNDLANNIDGGDGADDLAGGAGADILFGGADIDALNGGAGDDLLDGGAATDTPLDCGDGDGDIIIAGSGETASNCEL